MLPTLKTFLEIVFQTENVQLILRNLHTKQATIMLRKLIILTMLPKDVQLAIPIVELANIQPITVYLARTDILKHPNADNALTLDQFRHISTQIRMDVLLLAQITTALTNKISFVENVIKKLEKYLKISTQLEIHIEETLGL